MINFQQIQTISNILLTFFIVTSITLFYNYLTEVKYRKKIEFFFNNIFIIIMIVQFIFSNFSDKFVIKQDINSDYFSTTTFYTNGMIALLINIVIITLINNFNNRKTN